jgi:hypothetical protein
MTSGLVAMALALVMTSSTAAPENPDSSLPMMSVHAGLVTGSQSGLDLAWTLSNSLQWANAAGWQNEDRGVWLMTSDMLYLFDEAIGSIGAAGKLILLTGLGGQLDYRGYEETSLRYGGRVLFGIKLAIDDGRYELFSTVAWGLFHKPRIRASLDAVLGIRVGLW